jgi:hypothetical protein
MSRSVTEDGSWPVFRTGVRWCCVAAALGLGFAGEPARADIDWSDSGTLVIDVLPNGHGPSWSEGWDFELDATLVARGWGDSNAFGVSAPGGPPRERSVRFTDGIPIGHARGWAYSRGRGRSATRRGRVCLLGCWRKSSTSCRGQMTGPWSSTTPDGTHIAR